MLKQCIPYLITFFHKPKLDTLEDIQTVWDTLLLTLSKILKKYSVMLDVKMSVLKHIYDNLCCISCWGQRGHWGVTQRTYGLD